MTSSKQMTAMVDNESLMSEQKKFNHLNKKIETRKHVFNQWQQVILQYQQQIDNTTVIYSINACKIDILELFDRFYENKNCKKSQRDKLDFLIASGAKDLIESYGVNELIPLHNKYSQEKLQIEKAEADIVEGTAILNKKSKQISKSSQKAYRKLIASIYKDDFSHESGSDNKDDLLQQANLSYEEDNLLDLLALQLQSHHIKPDEAEAFSKKQLKYFNKILEEQLKELNAEIKKIEHDFSRKLKTQLFCHLKPEEFAERFDSDIKRLLESQLEVLQEKVDFFQQHDNIKAWLKKYKIPKDSNGFLFF